MTDETKTDDMPAMDALEVVNTIPLETLDRAVDDRERVGVYLAMADAAFVRLIEAGCNPDTVSMAVGRGTRDADGTPVAVATFRAFRPAEVTHVEPTPEAIRDSPLGAVVETEADDDATGTEPTA